MRMRTYALRIGASFLLGASLPGWGGSLPDHDPDLDQTASRVTAKACVADVESPLTCPGFTPPPAEDCNQSHTQFLWANGYIPFRINDPAGNAGAFNAAYEQTIRNVTAQWTAATNGVITFAECGCSGCPACSGRWLVISPGGNGGISNSSPSGPQYMSLSPNQAETNQVAHELGHAIYLPHEFERADRDRYVRLSESYFCRAPSDSYVRKCAILPTSNAADPPVQTGTFGVYDSTSKTNYFDSGEICENDNVEPDKFSGVPTAADGSAALELYRVGQGWAPFQGLGTDFSATAPLDYRLKSGVQMTGAPAVDTWGNGALDVFARGTDGHIYHKYKNISNGVFQSWSGWNEWTGTSFNSDPASVSWGPGRIDVVARAGTSNNIYLRSFKGTWTSWGSIGAPVGGASSAPAISSWGPGRLDVFVRGTDGGLYHKSCNDPAQNCAYNSGAWSGWQRRGNGTFFGKPAAVSWGTDKIDVFVHAEDHKVWSIWYDYRGWGSFYQLDFGTLYGSMASTASSPAVASWGVNRLDLFVRGTDSRLWHMFWDGVAWSGFHPLGGIMTGDPAAVSRLGQQRIDVAAPNVDHGAAGVWWKYWPLSMP